MKKLTHILAATAAIAVAAAAILLAGCAKDENFDRNLLIGEWSFTHDYGDGPEEIHNIFNDDGTGTTRYITGGSPNQRFTWTLKGETLTFVHLESPTRGIAAPEVCTVTTLNETTLIYISYGSTFRCTKVQ